MVSICLRPFKVDYDAQVGLSFCTTIEIFGVEAGEFGVEASPPPPVTHWIPARCLGVHPYRMQRVSLNASLCERKPDSDIGIAVSQDEAPFSLAYFIVRLWLGGKLSLRIVASWLALYQFSLSVDYMKDSCLMLCLHFNQRIFRLQCQDKCYTQTVHGSTRHHSHV